ncbi:site-specific DNA-methyltransferase [Thermoactinomyces sp. DSM 45892]|uniref:DNA-methyltransferase n=1 Tax=Thermoactinomyces sp. DSM 45892 TaxID=1882753 RepID=UPI000894B615|nr:site-specific DNA-methyltransferase [Thermoactinomyces sp. DSM 45892]SDY69106.1 site-specific DNA-methyltransferase (adenine-specific) [Thermoactinomyces sp. DSM 45892]
MRNLIIGDSLEEIKKIPSHSIDSIITDPPYCSGGFTEAQKKSAQKQGIRESAGTYQRLGWFDSDSMTTMGLVFLIRALGIEFHRVLRDGGNALLFCDWRMYPHLAPVLESTGMRLQNLIIWDKMDLGLGRGFRAQHELIMQFSKGKAQYHTYKGRNVISAKRVTPQKRLHPTEKPIELMEQLIQVVTPPEGTILDPFCGSGSTLVAAKRGGYDYIGIDREPEYIKITRERLDATEAIETV